MNASLHPTSQGWNRAEDSAKHGAGGDSSPRVGLVLSSGGARGLAHVGIIQVLEEEGVPIAGVAGCSMGSYVGALWCAGLGGAALEERGREIKDRATLKALMDYVIPPSTGLIRGDLIRKHLERDLGTKTFAELERPMLIIATDLDRLVPKVFDTGPVSNAVHASSAIPGICAPVHLDGRRYCDGGVSEPLPVLLLKRRMHLDHVIAVNVMPTPDDIEQRADSTFAKQQKAEYSIFSRPFRSLWGKVNLLAAGNVLDTFRRALMAAQLELMVKEEAAADVVIHPRFAASAWHDFENFAQYLQAGRDAAKAAMPAIRALFPPTHPLNRQEVSPGHEIAPPPHPRLEQLAA